jgi:hypothetical protein
VVSGLVPVRPDDTQTVVDNINLGRRKIGWHIREEEYSFGGLYGATRFAITVMTQPQVWQ